ncbi:MAG: hypothetical protein HDR03_14580 [Lachnospiraceae bacterium]|nr:hypothetical protein [Lachnospiraceae bacterium]
MTINGINGANIQMGMNQATDSYSRNIQNQIANAQKQLQELSSNEDMSLEEKMKKRQEIQQQISDLNVQLRQHQTEQRREKQQAKGSSMDDMLGATRNAEGKGTGLSQASMTAMISAGTSMKQAKTQGSVATKMEGRAGVLKSEIKLDQARDNDTQKKEEELADVQQKAQAATSSQLSTLVDASKTMQEAAKADSKEEKTDDKGTKENASDESEFGIDTQKETESGSESINTQSEVSVSNSTTAAETTTPQLTAYVSVDIRL